MVNNKDKQKFWEALSTPVAKGCFNCKFIHNNSERSQKCGIGQGCDAYVTVGGWKTNNGKPPSNARSEWLGNWEWNGK